MNSYVKSKYMFSNFAKDNIEQLKLGFVNMQLEHVYGRDGRKNKFVDYLLDELLSDHKSIELTECKQIKGWVYIDDVIASYMVIQNNLEFF